MIVFPNLFDAQFFDNNGAPLSNGTLRSVLAGTDSDSPTYNYNNEENDNPVPLDPSGRVQLKLNSAVTYDFILLNSSGGLVRTIPNVVGFTGTLSTDAVLKIGDTMTGDLLNTGGGSTNLSTITKNKMELKENATYAFIRSTIEDNGGKVHVRSSDANKAILMYAQNGGARVDVGCEDAYAAIKANQGTGGTYFIVADFINKRSYLDTDGLEVISGSNKLEVTATDILKNGVSLYDLIALLAVDSTVVHNTGNETIEGVKTFVEQINGFRAILNYPATFNPNSGINFIQFLENSSVSNSGAIQLGRDESGNLFIDLSVSEGGRTGSVRIFKDYVRIGGHAKTNKVTVQDASEIYEPIVIENEDIKKGDRSILNLWDDWRWAGHAVNPAGAAAPAVLTEVNTDEWHWVFSDGSTMAMPDIQIPHEYKEGTDIYPHIHFIPTTTGTYTGTWTAVFTLWDGGYGGATKTVYTRTAAFNKAMTAGVEETINFNYVISGVGRTISSCGTVTLKLALSAGTGLALLGFDGHYQKDLNGSHEITAK